MKLFFINFFKWWKIVTRIYAFPYEKFKICVTRKWCFNSENCSGFEFLTNLISDVGKNLYESKNINWVEPPLRLQGHRFYSLWISKAESLGDAHHNSLNCEILRECFYSAYNLNYILCEPHFSMILLDDYDLLLLCPTKFFCKWNKQLLFEINFLFQH